MSVTIARTCSSRCGEGSSGMGTVGSGVDAPGTLSRRWANRGGVVESPGSSREWPSGTRDRSKSGRLKEAALLQRRRRALGVLKAAPGGPATSASCGAKSANHAPLRRPGRYHWPAPVLHLRHPTPIRSYQKPAPWPRRQQETRPDRNACPVPCRATQPQECPRRTSELV